METRYWIARFRALIDTLDDLASKAGERGVTDDKTYGTELQSGKALGYSHASSLLRALIAEYVREATRSQVH